MKITCPESTCRAENDPNVESCIRCQTPLRSFAKLLTYQAHLFNQGLDLVRARTRKPDDFYQARDLFAAVVHWCPTDWEARNAFGAVCFCLGDLEQAREQWKHVAKNSPKNSPWNDLASVYLERLERISQDLERASQDLERLKKASSLDGQNLVVVLKRPQSERKPPDNSARKLDVPKRPKPEQNNQKNKNSNKK